MPRDTGSLLPTYFLITTEPQVTVKVTGRCFTLWSICIKLYPPQGCFSEHLLLSFLLFIEHLKCVVIVVQSLSLVSLRPRELQHVRLPCPSPSPWVCSNSCPLSWWRYLAISSSVVPFSSCLQSFPASGSFQWVSSLHQVAKVFSFSISPSSECSGLISFRIDSFDLLIVQGTQIPYYFFYVTGLTVHLTTLYGRCYYFHLTHGKTDTRRGKCIWPGYTACE